MSDGLEAANPDPTTATIVVDHNAAVVHGLPAEAVEPLLTMRRMVFEPGDRPGSHRDQLLWFVRRDHRDRAWFAPGLAEYVATGLRAQGHEVVVDDRREPIPGFEPDAELLAEAEPEDRRLMGMMAGSWRGQIPVGDRKDGEWGIAAICLLFPLVLIQILTGTRKRAWKLRQELWKRFGIVAEVFKGGWRKHARVTISMYKTADRSTRHQVIILADPQELTGIDVRWRIPRLLDYPSRVYAIRPRNWKSTPLEELFVQHFAGPVIDDGSPVDSPVRVVVYRIHSPNRQKGESDLDFKRRTIWHNDARNRAIAAIARDAAAGHLSAGHIPAATRGASGGSSNPALASITPRVAVLVESPEHGRQLQRLLPEWALLTWNGEKIDPAAEKPAGNVIVTAVYAAMNDMPADILIRADGGTFLPLIRGFPKPGIQNPLFIDLADTGDAGQKHLERRLSSYKSRGWTTPAQKTDDNDSRQDQEENYRESYRETKGHGKKPVRSQTHRERRQRALRRLQRPIEARQEETTH